LKSITVCRSLALLEVIVLLIFVPSARTLESYFFEALASIGVSPWELVMAVFIALLAASSWYFLWLLSGRVPFWLVIGHGVALAVIEAALISHIGFIVAEYVHIVSYALLYALVRFSWPLSLSRSPAVQFRCMLLVLLASLLDEGFQYMTPGRVGELRDVFTNAAGGLVGALYLELPLLARRRDGRTALR
jgi:hypothetical protein